MSPDSPRICDYEGSTYRTDFWENRGRNYEDLVERQVLRRLLPAAGRRLLEIGAGFGRLTPEYAMYDQVVLLDYSFSQLQYARERYGDERFLYVAADAYKLPFQPGAFDGATMIRVIHHFEDAPRVLHEVRRVLAPEANFILEYANKRNLKAMLRYMLGRQSWNPHDLDPVEFVELNYDFHPAYIQRELREAGFQDEARIPVSFFRLGLLKRLLPAGLLARMDQVMQRTGWLVAPSVFTRSRAAGGTPDRTSAPLPELFACPLTGAALSREGETLVSLAGYRWAIQDGIYNFKQPLEPSS